MLGGFGVGRFYIHASIGEFVGTFAALTYLIPLTIICFYPRLVSNPITNRRTDLERTCPAVATHTQDTIPAA
jgi:hypothetical protein